MDELTLEVSNVSIQAMAAVLEDLGPEVSGASRLVLLGLANHAGDTGECWPSVETIAREAALHPVTTQRVLTRLVNSGWIEREINAAPDQRIPAARRPNLYKLGTWFERGTRDVYPLGSTSRQSGVNIPCTP